MTVTNATPAWKQADFAWQKAIAPYARPSLRASLIQIATSLIPYLVLWGAMIWAYNVSPLLTLGLTVLAAGSLVRIFIIVHDCGHESFFKSQRLNDIVGSILGTLVFTPYYEWRHAHAIHHATAGNLNRRGVGDVFMLTVKEYNGKSFWGRLGYRLYRNPFIMFGIGPLFMFMIVHRFPSRNSRPRERNSVWLTNLAILGYSTAMSLLIGFERYAVLMVLTMGIAGVAGVWMFYVQHQFEGTYWEPQAEWSYVEAALRGSSYYKLPKILQWFTGNIGLHHIHHLSPRIPNYNLQACHDSNPPLQDVPTITLWPSFKSMAFKLWDEDNHRLVGFSAAQQLSREQKKLAMTSRVVQETSS
ncbi:MAG TPA: fatty acid desaturase [Anaerolineae bacterium]|nr:fatty acid desaturase [Anaerolineae bacterium]